MIQETNKDQYNCIQSSQITLLPITEFAVKIHQDYGDSYKGKYLFVLAYTQRWKAWWHAGGYGAWKVA